MANPSSKAAKLTLPINSFTLEKNPVMRGVIRTPEGVHNVSIISMMIMVSEE